MPAVANPITFGGSSRDYGYNPPSRVGFDDLPYLQHPVEQEAFLHIL